VNQIEELLTEVREKRRNLVQRANQVPPPLNLVRFVNQIDELLT
jgi:hypothetical protein